MYGLRACILIPTAPRGIMPLRLGSGGAFGDSSGGRETGPGRFRIVRGGRDALYSAGEAIFETLLIYAASEWGYMDVRIMKRTRGQCTRSDAHNGRVIAEIYPTHESENDAFMMARHGVWARCCALWASRLSMALPGQPVDVHHDGWRTTCIGRQ